MNRLVLSSLVALCLAANCGDSMAKTRNSKCCPDNKKTAISKADSVKKGLKYLISQQREDGGWSEGQESPHMRRAYYAKNMMVSNVADTCMAALSVIYSGSYPNRGPFAANVDRAVDFVCSSVESSDPLSIKVSDIGGTRLQSKLGQNIDTFYACLFLAEVKGHMPTEEKEARVLGALTKVAHKIEINQGKNGGWAGRGWAPVHSQAIATKGLNRAKQVGIDIDEKKLSLAEKNVKGNFDASRMRFSSVGSAGVALYAAGANAMALQSSIDTNSLEKVKLKDIIASPSTSPKAKVKARKKLNTFVATEDHQKKALSSLTKRIGDRRFISGFGCNGGEEFLSYYQISETLLANQSKEWPKWHENISRNVKHVQQKDGSWMGHHCITSRTFCTAAALMVLNAEKAYKCQIASLSNTKL